MEREDASFVVSSKTRRAVPTALQKEKTPAPLALQLHTSLPNVCRAIRVIRGVAASFSSLALVAVFAFFFQVGIVGLVATGLVYVVRAVLFGRREAYGQQAVTQRGEVVRSNSEGVIADYFSRSGIRYAYEQPAMSRWGFRRISRPEFYFPDCGVYVEYWGWSPSREDRSTGIRAEGAGAMGLGFAGRSPTGLQSSPSGASAISSPGLFGLHSPGLVKEVPWSKVIEAR